MQKEPLNRAQRRRFDREAKAHVPSFWDSMFNRVWVIGLAAAFVGVIVYSAMSKTSQTATTPKPAAPAPSTPPATTPPATPPQPTTPPADKPKTDAKITTEDVKAGTGDAIKVGDVVTVDYTGTLDDGTKFDSSKDPGKQPMTFTVGQGMIAGFAQGVVGMKEGGRRKVTVPAELGYGAAGRPGIPPNATLHFDIEVKKVEHK
jgi:peptidylprolyl isomerase